MITPNRVKTVDPVVETEKFTSVLCHLMQCGQLPKIFSMGNIGSSNKLFILLLLQSVHFTYIYIRLIYILADWELQRWHIPDRQALRYETILLSVFSRPLQSEKNRNLYATIVSMKLFLVRRKSPTLTSRLHQYQVVYLRSLASI